MHTPEQIKWNKREFGEHLTPERLAEMHTGGQRNREAIARMMGVGFDFYWKPGGHAGTLGLSVFGPDGYLMARVGSMTCLGMIIGFGDLSQEGQERVPGEFS